MKNSASDIRHPPQKSQREQPRDARVAGPQFPNRWVRTCRTLPEPVWQECVRRFRMGETANTVSRWLLTLPDRGGMQGITRLESLTRYIHFLRKWVREAMQKRDVSAVAAQKVSKAGEPKGPVIRKVISIKGGPLRSGAPGAAPAGNSQHNPQTFKDGQGSKRPSNTREMLEFTFNSIDSQVEVYRELQRKLNRPVPEMKLLLRLMVQVAAESNHADKTELAREQLNRELRPQDRDSQNGVSRPAPAAPVNSAQTGAERAGSQEETELKRKTA